MGEHAISRPKTWDSAHGYIQCVPLHIGDPVMRTDGHVSITSLPKFLGLIGYQISLARYSAEALARGLSYNVIEMLFKQYLRELGGV